MPGEEMPVTTEVTQRLKQYLAWKQLKPSQVADMMGTHPMTINRMLNGSNFGVETLIQFLAVVPDLNVEWLYKGEGAMENSKAGHSQAQGLMQQLELLRQNTDGLNDEQLAERSTQMLRVVRGLCNENHQLSLEIAEQMMRTMKVYSGL